MDKNNTKLLQDLTDALNEHGVLEFCQQLQRVAKHQGGLTRLAEASSLNRESLYKALGGKRDPRFSTVVETLRALGMKFRIEIDREQLEEELGGISGFEGAWLDLYLSSPGERLKQADLAIETRRALALVEPSNQ